MAAFLASSLCDDKIVNPDVCDTIIQGVLEIGLLFIGVICLVDFFYWRGLLNIELDILL